MEMHVALSVLFYGFLAYLILLAGRATAKAIQDFFEALGSLFIAGALVGLILLLVQFIPLR